MEQLERRVEGVAADVTAIRRAIMGDMDEPGGIVQRVRDNEQRAVVAASEIVRVETAMRSEIARIEAMMKAEIAVIHARREETVAEYERRVNELEDWKEALHNRTMGMIVGLSLGSAGVGAAVASTVSHLLGS
jgi:hypothetical protein